ncbi:MAG: hypothetical protein Q8R53_04855 [Nanoarchaeota archaeon]|nr:hypothetical protein [Nanoarchaeota archaeon]
MIETLQYAIPHQKVPQMTVAAFLEVLRPNNQPSIFSLHLAEFEAKEVRRGFMPMQTDYERVNPQTIVYEYDCKREELRRIAFYFGDFRDPDFAYPECLAFEEKGNEVSAMSLALFSRHVQRVHACLGSELNALRSKAGQKRETLERFQTFVSLLEKIVEGEGEKNP